jgi:CheY-like chemotaxis protein
MPVMDGYVATQAIRNRQIAKRFAHKGEIPILAFTADRRP